MASIRLDVSCLNSPSESAYSSESESGLAGVPPCVLYASCAIRRSGLGLLRAPEGYLDRARLIGVGLRALARTSGATRADLAHVC
jgi:hypothetical protein